MNATARLAAIDAITAKIPAFECVPGCAECCGPVIMTRLEWRRVVKVMEDHALSERQLAKKADEELKSGNYGCPMLAPGNRCGCYEARPLICRLFGVVDTPRLVCPYGKAPEVKLTREQADAMIDAVERLGR